MYELRLLERISQFESSKSTVSENDISRAISSIGRHLQKMLNIRKGSVIIDKDYGIPDFTNTIAESINEMGLNMAKEIKDFISKYEPRLGNVRVVFLKEEHDTLSLKFKIEGELIFKGRIPVTFETWMDQSGKIVISE